MSGAGSSRLGAGWVPASTPQDPYLNSGVVDGVDHGTWIKIMIKMESKFATSGILRLVVARTLGLALKPRGTSGSQPRV